MLNTLRTTEVVLHFDFFFEAWVKGFLGAIWKGLLSSKLVQYLSSTWSDLELYATLGCWIHAMSFPGMWTCQVLWSAKLLDGPLHCILIYFAVISYRGLGINGRRNKRHKALIKSSAKLKDEAVPQKLYSDLFGGCSFSCSWTSF